MQRRQRPVRKPINKVVQSIAELFELAQPHARVVARAVAFAYTTLVFVAVPLAALSLVLITGKTSFVDNVGFLYSRMAGFMKFVATLTPGDYILGAIVILYHRNFLPSLAFLAGGGFMYVFGNFCIDPVSDLIKTVGPTSAQGLVLQILYTALIMGILLTSCFLPTIIAYLLKKPNWKKFLLFNVLVGWIIPAIPWLILVFFAFKKPKVKAVEEKPTESTKPQPGPVHKRELKKNKGKKKK